MTLDPVTLEVIRNALPAVANEMAADLQRTSYNMMIYEVRDFCTALINPAGELIAQNVGGVSHFVADLGVIVQDGMRRYGKGGFAPGDVVITKQRASVFFGTPLIAHLTQLGVQTLIVCGESTSGCVRASAVDAYSHGFHVVLVEECCFDRSLLSHKVNLFDMHHKYADVMHIDEVLAHFDCVRMDRAAE